MSTIRSRAVVIAALALVGVAAGAAAQGRENLLTSIEVTRLVASTQPADQARLRDHFDALAEEYTAEAARHRSMARSLTGNPNRRSGVSLGAHCERLAELSSESAATVRELAAHYGRLAAGMPSTPPANSARFVAGEGAPAPTDAQLRELAAGARTLADHRSLEEYYLTLANAHDKAAQRHATMSGTYRASGIRSLDPAIHCDRMVKSSRDAAEKARTAAAEHGQRAQIG